MKAAHDHSLQALAWPSARLAEGVDELARRAELQPHAPEGAVPSAAEGELDRWLPWAARRLGVEAEAVGTQYGELEDLLLAGGPAVLQADLPGGDGGGFLLVLRGRGARVQLLAPDLSVRRVDAAVLRDALCAQCEAPHLGEVEHLLALAQVPQAKQAAVRAAVGSPGTELEFAL